MDALDPMLTDPLDLGPCMENNGIMEECLLRGTRVSLPEDLLEDPDLFFDVVSLDTWQNVLSDSQREHLKQFLPSCPNENGEQQEATVRALFRGDNFRFGNPLQTAQKLFRDGHFNPEVVKYRQLCLKSQHKRYVSSQQQYFHTLLKQILASRKVSCRPFPLIMSVRSQEMIPSRFEAMRLAVHWVHSWVTKDNFLE